MAIIAPFKGVTYNFDKITNIEKVVAPPYDVISDREQDEYYKKDPYNIVRLILGKRKMGDSDWDNRYTRAADLFERWDSEEILIRHQFPSIYLTSIEYESPDTIETRTRWGFIALVRIEENDSSIILPHEKTFSFHREDRLKLMRACNAQFSPVFSLYEDKGNVIVSTCKKITDSPPKISFRDSDGCYHKMWEVTSDSIIKDIASEMSSKSIIIADGHHRYESARSFRNLMRTRYGVHRLDRAYEYVMMYLTNITDKGLTILPSHRLFKSYPDFKIKKFLSSTNKWFDISTFPFSANSQGTVKMDFLDQLKEYGQNRSVFGFYHSGAENYYLLCLKSEAREEIGDDVHPSIKKLDVLVLSRLILQRILGIKRDDLDNEKIIQYESNTNGALSSVHSGDYQMVFLVNPPKIEQMVEVTGNSLLMPRKSTYFHPKILSGLVFNKIDPYETIQIPGQ
ncbi:MAG: DUF1015 domain-containing protein [Desulfobacteraceae bacterium]|nr:MAG: DUF1015 domain-containing protein [Desulfobacteraceae bacterium]